MRQYFTSESVSEGHPDKICDQVSDVILDALLADDREARGGIECLCTQDYLLIAGEKRGGDLDAGRLESLARETIKDIGYTYEEDGFHWERSHVDIRVHSQSGDIARGVDADASRGKSEGAGDQGMMFGYACDETEALMPAALHYAHRILRALSEGRRSGRLEGLKADGKSQLTLVYEDGEPQFIETVVVSHHHSQTLGLGDVEAMVKAVVSEVVPPAWLRPETRYHINPAGVFHIGGPKSDAGLTGRKIIVDTYGGAAPHGGGAFSGKDSTKVDRSAAYMARYLAKNVVAAELAQRCTIQLAYAIGVSEPVSLRVNTSGTHRVAEHKIAERLRELVDMTPRGIIDRLGLARPIYRATSTYGHFGRNPREDGAFSWERTDLVEALRSSF